MVAWALMLPKPPTKRLSFWAPDSGEGNDFQIGRPTYCSRLVGRAVGGHDGRAGHRGGTGGQWWMSLL